MYDVGLNIRSISIASIIYQYFIVHFWVGGGGSLYATAMLKIMDDPLVMISLIKLLYLITSITSCKI